MTKQQLEIENVITFFSKLHAYHMTYDKEIPENIVFHVHILDANKIPIGIHNTLKVGMRFKLLGFNCKIV